MRSRAQLALAFATALEGEDRTVLEELALPELEILVQALEEPKSVVAELATSLLSTIVPAAPGWRLAILGPDTDDEACPIVAWAVVDAGLQGGSKLTLEPIARYHGQDGYSGVAINAGVNYDRVVGLLAPGEDFDGGWAEACEQQRRANLEQEEREARTGVSVQTIAPEPIRVEVEKETRARLARAELRQAVWDASQHLTLDEIRELAAGVVLEIESDEP